MSQRPKDTDGNYMQSHMPRKVSEPLNELDFGEINFICIHNCIGQGFMNICFENCEVTLTKLMKEG